MSKDFISQGAQDAQYRVSEHADANNIHVPICCDVLQNTYPNQSMHVEKQPYPSRSLEVKNECSLLVAAVDYVYNV